MNAPCVKGNHDEYCTMDHPLDGFNAGAAKAVQWTRKQLTADDRLWLQNLPYVRKVEDFVHEGDDISVKVLEVGRDGKIRLSLREAQEELAKKAN